MGKPKPAAAPDIDIVKARAALTTARKAYDVVDRKRAKALVRLNAAQNAFDKAAAAIKANAPAGSKWGDLVGTLSGPVGRAMFNPRTED